MTDELRFLDDARWNPERECVEATALIAGMDGEMRVTCAVAREALEGLVRASGHLDPIRLFRDFEGTLARIAGQRHDPRIGEIVITGRDIENKLS